MNLFGMLTQMGLAWGTTARCCCRWARFTTRSSAGCYRGLDSLVYGAYNARWFVVVGTPSGATLVPESGAHQSSVTASIRIELLGRTFAEPAYALALDWLLCDGWNG